jgi:hypothetical protein
MAMETHAMVEVLLGYNNGNGVFYAVCAKCYKQSQSGSEVRVVKNSVE